ncbi:hypothetical protein GmRootV35_13770 [Variovorax sp. V35]
MRILANPNRGNALAHDKTAPTLRACSYFTAAPPVMLEGPGHSERAAVVHDPDHNCVAVAVLRHIARRQYLAMARKAALGIAAAVDIVGAGRKLSHHLFFKCGNKHIPGCAPPVACH